MTLYEIDLLSRRHRHRQEREDRRAAFSGWVLANINRDSEKRREAFTLEEVVAWLGYARQYVPQPPPPAPEEPGPPSLDALRQKIDIVHLLHRGLYGENGQQAEDS